MGKGKEAKGKDKRGGGKVFSAPEEMVAKQPTRGMPSSDEESEEEEVVQLSWKVAQPQCSLTSTSVLR